MSYTHSIDEVFINVFTETGLTSAAARDQLPVHLPGEGDRGQAPDRTSTAGFKRDRRRAVSGVVDGPIDTVSNTTTWVKGRHTFKGGVIVEYSGEDDFDQINVNAIPGGTNNQNGRFEFQDTAAGRFRAWRSPTLRSAYSTTTQRLESVRLRNGGRLRPTSSCRIPGSRRAS